MDKVSVKPSETMSSRDLHSPRLYSPAAEMDSKLGCPRHESLETDEGAVDYLVMFELDSYHRCATICGVSADLKKATSDPFLEGRIAIVQQPPAYAPCT
jgi:hypothetical protein